MKYQLLIIWGDVEPELDNHKFDTRAMVLERALQIRHTEGDEHGLFYLMIDDDGNVEVDSFSGGEMMTGEESWDA